MSDTTIELKVIQLALLLLILITGIVFSLRLGHDIYQHWRAPSLSPTQPRPSLKMMTINFIGLATCALLLNWLNEA